MSSRHLERIRTKLEEIDSLRDAIVQTLRSKQSDPKRSVIYDYRLKNLITQVQIRSLDILSTYKSSSRDIQLELSSIQLHDDNLSSLFSKYYTEVKTNRDYNQNNGIEDLRAASITTQGFIDSVFRPPLPVPEFSEAEDQGRCVDLSAIYALYMNLKAVQVPEIDGYLLFVRDIEKIYGASLSHKLKSYKEYYELFEGLGRCLIDFHRRIQPLSDVSGVYSGIEADFEERFANRDIDNYFEADEEEARTFHCDACMHEFINENTFNSHFNGKKHRKNVGTAKTGIKPQTPNPVHLTKKYKLAKAEYISLQYKDLLEEEFENALNKIRQKQTADIDQEDNASIKSVTNEDKDDEQKTYNTKNMPIGWDGKPIPMWVYKLHGLGIEYKCEICGNYSYWGRQAFEKHFTEWRHTYGMKCLRIPNTMHFREITSINDALVLHKKLAMESRFHKFNADNEEEFEDSEGNVLTKRTYEDLKREGLL